MSFLARIREWFRAPGVQSVAGPLPLPVVAVGDQPDWPAILAAVGFVEPAMWARHIAFPAARRGIHRGRRAAAFAATIGHESAGGRILEENMRYSTRRLMEIWPRRFPTIEAARPFAWDASDPDREDIALANRVYGGRMGNEDNGTADNDGWERRGRGLIGLTGMDAYRLAADATGLPLIQQPDLAAQPNVAAEIACWAWAAWKGCNPLADAGNVEGWRRAINGGLIGLDDVRRRYEAALKVAG
jgi:putative chitinase